MVRVCIESGVDWKDEFGNRSTGWKGEPQGKWNLLIESGRGESHLLYRMVLVHLP